MNILLNLVRPGDGNIEVGDTHMKHFNPVMIYIICRRLKKASKDKTVMTVYKKSSEIIHFNTVEEDFLIIFLY